MMDFQLSNRIIQLTIRAIQRTFSLKKSFGLMNNNFRLLIYYEFAIFVWK